MTKSTPYLDFLQGLLAHTKLFALVISWKLLAECDWKTGGGFPLLSGFGVYIYMVISKNRCTSKSSILIGFSIINHPFWGTPIFGNTHIYIYGMNVHHCLIILPRWLPYYGCTSKASWLLGKPSTQKRPLKLTTKAPKKLDGWNTILSYWVKRPIFRGKLAVRFREGMTWTRLSISDSIHLTGINLMYFHPWKLTARTWKRHPQRGDSLEVPS